MLATFDNTAAGDKLHNPYNNLSDTYLQVTERDNVRITILSPRSGKTVSFYAPEFDAQQYEKMPAPVKRKSYLDAGPMRMSDRVDQEVQLESQPDSK